MTIKELFRRFPEIKTICWVSPTDFLASGNILRDLCSEREMNLKVRFWAKRRGYIHCVLKTGNNLDI